MRIGEALAAGTPCVVRDGSSPINWTRYENVAVVRDPFPSRVAGAVARVERCYPDVVLQTWDDGSTDCRRSAVYKHDVIQPRAD
jgi:hypothetical protein